MLNITVHRDTDLSREEIVAVVSLIYGFWPSKEKSIPELVETFPEVSRQYRASYPQIRFPSLRYVVWNENKAVAHGLTFERPVITDAGEISVMALSGVCVSPSYQGKGLGAEIVRRAFGRVHGGEFGVSLFQTTIPAFYEKLGATSVTNRFVNSRNKTHPDANPWHDPWVMIYPRSHPWPQGQIDLNGPDY
jgi:GNAT superfamily N-acetyltransferase